MGKFFKTIFVSNYINHHQIPFCNAMNRLLQGEFLFIQTEPMEEERVRMGWHEAERPEYVRCYYEEEEICRQLILESDVVLFGGTEEESYIADRLKAGRPVIRYSERLYRTGQWKAVSPRGLKKKYQDHTRYRKAQVYLLCAGAYVASDFHIVRAYPGKMFRWGYFPETKHYEIEKLVQGKGYGDKKVPYLLWAARMIELKHPELPLETAGYLKAKGLEFHMDLIGDGALRPRMEALAAEYELGDSVSFLGFQSPEAVRHYMEKADIFLFTSDRQEGWGAVANEAMNSACALVADHMIGAVPYLVQNGRNGLIYRDGRKQMLFSQAEKLVRDRQFCRELGKQAYRTITDVWNAENAAGQLMQLICSIMEASNKEGFLLEQGNSAAWNMAGGFGSNGGIPPAPCTPAPILSERFVKPRS